MQSLNCLLVMHYLTFRTQMIHLEWIEHDYIRIYNFQTLQAHARLAQMDKQEARGSLYSEVSCLERAGASGWGLVDPCRVRSNESWIMVTRDPSSWQNDWQVDRHDWKLYHPQFRWRAVKIQQLRRSRKIQMHNCTQIEKNIMIF